MSVKVLSSGSASWRDEWCRLAIRIEQQCEIALRFVSTAKAMHGIEGDRFADEVLVPRLGELQSTLKAFMNNHGAKLPAGAQATHSEALAQGRDFYNGGSGLPSAVTRAIWLTSVRNELEPFMNDSDTLRVCVVERAFLHLQRLIVADADVRAKWEVAFDRGETSCEKLGAVQLLHHGIYAVKTNAEGERTDLVLGKRYNDSPTIRRAADAMALTEWKRITHSHNYADAKRQAFDQALRYGRGLLAGFDIERTRFLVLVTEDVTIDMEGDILHQGVAYRPINIAVRPAAPSDGSEFA